MTRVVSSLGELFWPRVDMSGGPESCWPWIGYVNNQGYGKLKFGGRNGRLLRAPRVAYELLVGPIPEGLHLDHLCRNRACVNPAHLEPVTPRENTNRGINHYRVRTHCKNGHEFTVASTRMRGRNTRICRPCGTKTFQRQQVIA